MLVLLQRVDVDQLSFGWSAHRDAGASGKARLRRIEEGTASSGRLRSSRRKKNTGGVDEAGFHGLLGTSSRTSCAPSRRGLLIALSSERPNVGSCGSASSSSCCSFAVVAADCAALYRERVEPHLAGP